MRLSTSSSISSTKNWTNMTAKINRFSRRWTSEVSGPKSGSYLRSPIQKEMTMRIASSFKNYYPLSIRIYTKRISSNIRSTCCSSRNSSGSSSSFSIFWPSPTRSPGSSWTKRRSPSSRAFRTATSISSHSSRWIPTSTSASQRKSSKTRNTTPFSRSTTSLPNRSTSGGSKWIRPGCRWRNFSRTLYRPSGWTISRDFTRLLV